MVNPLNLLGKTAFLTGASKGLGRELAFQLDARGCRLLLVARSVAKLDSLITELDTPGSRPFPCDLSDVNARSQLVQQVQAAEQRLDLIIHCAGIGSHSRLDQLTAEEINLLLQLDTIAPLELTAALLPLLPPGEAAGIVNIGSIAGELITPGMSLYSAGKTALHSFSRAAGIELAAQGHFSLLVILGALKGTNFSQALRHPAQGQPGWYRKLDVDAAAAAARITQAIEQERSQLVMPGWYSAVLFLSRLLAPITQAATRRSYQQLRAKN